MKSVITVFSLILVFSWNLSSFAVDEKQQNKKIEKRYWIQEQENKAGLGIVVTDQNDETDSQKSGIRIIEVFEGSEADEIGLEKGDLIVEVNKKAVEKPSDLVDVFKDLEEGQEVALSILRDGQKKEFNAKIRPFSGRTYAFHDGDFDEGVAFDFAHTPHEENFSKLIRVGELGGLEGKGGFLGVQVKNLTDQLQQYFEVSNGVLIEEVIKDSPAEKAGLKAGDVITSINDRKIEDPQDLVRTVNYYNPEEEVAVTFSRKGSNKQVKAILKEKPAFRWNMQKMKGPHGLKIIKEGDDNAIFMNEEGSVNLIDIREKDGNKTIEINKEILIL